MKQLTERQAFVLETVRKLTLERNGISPTLREIGDAVGIKSTNGVHDHLRALRRKGYLTSVGPHKTARSIRVVDGVTEEERSASSQAMAAKLADVLVALRLPRKTPHRVMMLSLYRNAVAALRLQELIEALGASNFDEAMAMAKGRE